jgi:hypothetical protein
MNFLKALSIGFFLVLGIGILGGGLGLLGMASASSFPNFGPALILIFAGTSTVCLTFAALTGWR